MKQQLRQSWKLFLIASLTLGLAPFTPPHIVGKLNWILGGGAFSGELAMQFKDWFDVLLHGSPWILLVISIVLNLSALLTKDDLV
ncbi:hypothetical protein CXF68_06275 [Tenacibaculum sp. Bg11-29]|uniref:hypothetical protein n=1 Tax=Tenacibaculum sp. Bg11-29 TaxID=2058306 RepID=UPI000C31E731|nr:hypothetical protein [Tenacibaculum sp. Bg11-29]PKH50329.1 hypothetical protein CXF68_06275 [Tenacibaculum sp. Bg11-29]